MRTRLQNLWDILGSSYWFVPSVMLVSAAALSLVMQELDSAFQGEIARAYPGIFDGGPDGARSMLATIAGSMITAAAVTFSITIAALANASSQYGPRLLRIFMQDTGSQIVLGTFIGTFIYCILALRLVPANDSSADVPHLSTTVALMLAVASIGLLIYFIHNIASMLQVSHVAARVGEEMLAGIGTLFPEELGTATEEREDRDAIPLSGGAGDVLPDGDHLTVVADRIGYIQAVDTDRLMSLAVEHNVVTRVVLRPGAFIVPRAGLAVVWPSDRASEDLQNALQEVFLVGDQRTPYQDIELYFDELIEIALRALSPGINDPNTAMICMDWLTAGLATLGARQLPSRYRYDSDGQLRIIADAPQLPGLIDHTFDQVRQAGSSMPVILKKLFDMIETLGPLCVKAAERAALHRQAMATDWLVRNSNFPEHERLGLHEGFREALEVLNAVE